MKVLIFHRVLLIQSLTLSHLVCQYFFIKKVTDLYKSVTFLIWLYYCFLINRKPYFLVYLLSNNKLKNFTFQSGYILRNSKPKTLHSILVIFQSGFLLVTIITLFSYIVNENITFIVL